MTSTLADLGFADWPFATVPDEYNTTFSCDRAWLVERVDGLLDSYALRASTIVNLVWSDVGAGKTHTMKHLAFKAAQRGFRSCFYFEMPERASSFVDVHDAIVSTVGLERLLDSFVDNQSLYEEAPILNQLAQASYTGHNTEQAAKAWINGTASLADRRLLGLPRDLTIQQAIANVAVLIKALATGNPRRTIVMIDEFQRVAQRGGAASRAVQNGLCSLINAVPTGLGLILAFQAPPGKDLPGWVDAALSSRVGMSHFVPIMVLSRSEALQFLEQIIARYSLPGKKGIFPFTTGVLKKLVELAGGDRVLPRDLLARAGNALENYVMLDGAGTREMAIADLGSSL